LSTLARVKSSGRLVLVRAPGTIANSNVELALNGCPRM
jgi:hypothetical protein